VQLIVTNGICSDTLSQLVGVAPKATTLFIMEEPICFGTNSEVTFAGAATPGAIFTWNFGGGNIEAGTGSGPYTISWPAPGVYNLSLSIKQHSCASDTTNKSVTVKTCSLTIPNVITPNGDGLNDVFKIIGLEAFPQSGILIYNRWGTEVYKSSDYKNDWDGGPHSDGVYYYLLTVKDGTKYHGTVTVLR
jgi:gliding motility-associated-like protein